MKFQKILKNKQRDEDNNNIIKLLKQNKLLFKKSKLYKKVNKINK